MLRIKVYLDNCAYNRPFDDQRQIRIFLEAQAKLHIQRLIVGNKLVLACSYMSHFENNDNPHEERQLSIANFFSHALLFVNQDKADKIEAKAAEIMKLLFAVRLILSRYWRLRMNDTAAIVNKGMKHLLEKLGALETEIFISHLLREPFDYTKWRRDNLYEDISLHELNQKAAQYAKEHPFKEP